MNMISTGTFLNGMDASNKQSELVKKLVTAWEKKNSKAARAGGVSLMALSLAACGADDTTPFAQSDIDAATAPLSAAVIVAEAALAAAQTDAATALVAQAAAETQAAGALVSAAAATAAAASSTAAKATAEAALATAQAALTAANAEKATLQASYDALVTSNASLQTTYDALVAPASSSLVTALAETLTGTAGNDTFTGNATFYTAGDSIVDGFTTDADTYTLTVSAANASANNTFTGGNAAGGGVEIGPNITNVETVNMNVGSTAALEISAQNMTGVSNLTITKTNVVVGGTEITGNKALVVFGLDASDVATVTAGAGTTTMNVTQVTKAGTTVNADAASGNVTVAGAATVNAAGAGTGDAVAMTVLSNATEDAKAVTVTTGAENVNLGAFTGTISVTGAATKSTDLAGAAGGVTVNILGEAGTAGSANTGVDITGIDSSGATVTTSYAGTSTAPGAIQLTGSAATTDVATVSAVGFNSLDLNTTAIETVNLSGNGAAATYTITGQAASVYAASGANAVNLAGNEAMFAGKTITGVNTIDLTAGTAGTVAAGLWTSTKVDLGFDNQGNAITVGSNANYEITNDQTTGLDFDFSATANGAVTITAGDDNGTSATVGTIGMNAVDANAGATSTGTVTIEASIANVTGTTLTAGALQAIVVTGDEDVNFSGVVTGGSFSAIDSTGIITLSGLTTGVATVSTGAGNDAITINSGTTNHSISTYGGNDTVTVTATQNGNIVTGDGNDTINVDDVTGAYVVVAGNGTDTVVLSGDADAVLNAGTGADTLRVDGTAAIQNNANATISGFTVFDLDAALTLNSAQWANNSSTAQISSGSSNGTLTLGGTGTDTVGITIDASNLTAETAGTTNVVSINGTALLADTLTGGALNETFNLGTGDDSLEGGSTGTDTIVLADNADVDGAGLSGDNSTGMVINMGGTALEEATVTGSTSTHFAEGLTQLSAGQGTFNFANAAATTSGSVNAKWVQNIGGMENVTGGDGKDYVIGTSGANTMIGNGGADYLSGGDGDDLFVYTSTGALVGSNAFVDQLVGGLGTDSISINNNGLATVTIANTDDLARVSGVETIRAHADSDKIISVTTHADAHIDGIRNIDLSADTDATSTNVVNGVNTTTGGFTITGSAGVDTINGTNQADTITGGLAADYIDGNNGIDTISLTEAVAAADEVELVAGATNYSNITGFSAGGGAANDNLSALDATYSWFGDGTSNVDGIVGLASSTTLKAANLGDDNATVITITVNAAANTFDDFVAGTTTEAAMEGLVITGLGLTGALKATDIVLVAIDDGEDTGIFKFDGADAIDNAVATGEIQILAILQGVADASTLAAADVLFA
jgi:hypothetical protein